MLAPREIVVSEEAELVTGRAVDELFRPKGLAEVLTELNIRPFSAKEIKQIKAGAARAQQWQTMKRHKYGYLAITFCVFVVAVMVAALTLYAGSLLGFSGSARTGLAISTAVALLVGAWFVYVDTRVLWGTVPLWQFRDIMPRGVINRIDAIQTAMPEAKVLVHFCRIDPIIIVCHEQQQFCVAAWDMKEVLLPNVE